MKKLSILALCATLAIAPAFAEMTAHYNTPSVELSTQSALLSTAYEPTTLPTVPVDLSFAFNDIENLQAVAMTDKEMKETEGVFSLVSINTSLAGRGTLMGANIANWEYLGGVVAGGDYNPYTHAFHVGVGAMGGAYAGAVKKTVPTPTQHYIASRLGAVLSATEQRLSQINY